MAKSAGGGAGSPDHLPQHPYVERLKPDPSQPAKRVVDLTGLPGNSDRPGYQRVYLTSRLDYYAEFLTSDMVHAEAVPADQSPFSGLEATRVSVNRDATIHYTWARSPQPVDEFDLDVRLGAAGAAAAALPQRTIANGCTDACHTQVTCATCHTCQTQCNQATCHTCQTQCNQPTCPATCQTCQTQCNQATCHTCAGQATCHTCQTQCNQHTCVTCATCHTCVTCLPPPHCPLPP